MRTFKIVADSSCDILSLQDIPFAFAPMKIITADREFTDDAALDVADMARYFETCKTKSQTSCPNATDWLEAFGDADDIVCVTITSALSGSYNAACMAKQMYESEHDGRRVFVLDTLSAGPEIGLVVQKLCEYAQNGMEYTEICQNITEYITNTGLLFMLKSLRNFANNGRVSPAVAKIAGIMGICIVGKASDQGTLEPTDKCRGETRSIETLVSHLQKHGLSHGKVRIAHCNNRSAAEQIKDRIREVCDAQVELCELRGLCSFYAEQGGVLVGYEKQ